MATVLPVLLGASLAFHYTGTVLWGKLALSVIAMLLIHTGGNLINDYFDYRSGNDNVNIKFNPFSGGSRVIQDGLIKPQHILYVSLTSFAIGSIIGLYIDYISKGHTVLILGLIGVFTFFFQTAPPLRFGYRGLGELSVWATLGILTVLGSYWVQTGTFHIAVIPIGASAGFLVAGILFINEYPDYDADRAVGKRTLVVIIGPKGARVGFFALIICSFLSIIVGAILGYIPYIILFTLLAVPLAIDLTYGFSKTYNKFPEIVKYCARMVQFYIIMLLLLNITILIDSFL
ncbi:MAG: prenyltransferase [bacterium]